MSEQQPPDVFLEMAWQLPCHISSAAYPLFNLGEGTMKSHPRCFLMCLTASTGLILLAAAPPQPGPAELERLVQDLVSHDSRKQLSASKRLVNIGKPALATLRKALFSDQQEMGWRARRVIDAIEHRLTGEQVRLIDHLPYEVWSISLSKDGKRLLTCSEDRMMRLWDADTGKCLLVFEAGASSFRNAVLSPDGKRVLSGGFDKTVQLWDATTGNRIRCMTGHTGKVYSVAFGPKGQAISGATDETMRLWDLRTGKCIGVYRGHDEGVVNVAYSDKAKLAATCSWDLKVRLWDLESGKQVRRFDNLVGPCVCLGFSPDGKRLLSPLFATTSRIVDVKTGKTLNWILARTVCGAFSPDGKRLVTGGQTTVRLWDAVSGKQLRKYEGHTNWVNGVIFSPDGKRIVSASSDGTVRIWRVPR
jgi:WD40 repeat protein